jgi:rare lipoprotein A
MIQLSKSNLMNVAGAFAIVAGLSQPSAAIADEGVKHCRFLQSGEASWYGPGFHGKKTASGQTFNQNAMTAAHNGLPFGTVVTVVTEDGKKAEVKINDTGGFKKYDRIIDTSRAAAIALGFKDAGTADVSLYLC